MKCAESYLGRGVCFLLRSVLKKGASVSVHGGIVMLSVESNNVVEWDCWKHFVLVSTLMPWTLFDMCSDGLRLFGVKHCFLSRSAVITMNTAPLICYAVNRDFVGRITPRTQCGFDFHTALWKLHKCQLSNNKRRLHSRSVCYCLISVKPGRNSFCLSSLCNVGAPYSGVEAFGNISSPLCTLAILWPLCKILRRSS